MSSLRPTERFDSRQVTPRPTPRALEMSHGALDAYRDAYARVRVEREAWSQEHARARALFGAVVNAFERLPALARAMTRKTYGDDVEATFARVTVSAQYASLDAMFVGLVEACEGLERVATAMRRAKTDAWRRIDAMEHAPSLGGGEGGTAAERGGVRVGAGGDVADASRRERVGESADDAGADVRGRGGVANDASIVRGASEFGSGGDSIDHRSGAGEERGVGSREEVAASRSVARRRRG